MQHKVTDAQTLKVLRAMNKYVSNKDAFNPFADGIYKKNATDQDNENALS